MIPTPNFGRHVLNQVESGIGKEWLETNGLGSYAMGTVIGANTRKYHSLFVMTSGPGLRRTVMVNRVEESVLIRGKRVDLSCQEYPDSISPQGHQNLEEFTAGPFPTWTYAVDDLKIRKQFFLRSEEQTAVLVYKHLVGPSVKFILRPFLSCRDQHALAQEDRRFENAIQLDGNTLRCAVPNMPEFFMTLAAGEGISPDSMKFYLDGYWYKNLVYVHEEEREQDYREDLYSPGQVILELSQGQEVALVFSDQRLASIDLRKWEDQEIFVRKQILEDCPLKSPFAQKLAVAADQFVIRRDHETHILKGYPWHDCFLRETLISLPGILLAANRLDEAKELLRRVSKMVRNGLLPDRCAKQEGDPVPFSNIDNSLWFILALQKTWAASRDDDFMKEMKPVVEAIVISFIMGIRVNEQRTQIEAGMDTDKLLTGASPHSPLTWMNGRVGDWVVTPRRGKAVEIQALWYNALQFCTEIRLKFDQNDQGLGNLARDVRSSFNYNFWNPQNNYLYDVIDGNVREGSIRPNALFAISLPYEILDNDKFQPLMETAWRTLYTSLGLRTLARQELHFRGIYRGDEKNRVSAAHNGTVYPFFIGPFLTAYFKTYGHGEDRKAQAVHFLSPFINHLVDAGLGTISELFDGDTPHNPRGCVADAMAVGEILRVIKEESLDI